MEIADIADLQYRNLKTSDAGNILNKKMQNEAEAKKLKDACRDFESLFIKQMLDSMKKTVNKSGLLDGGMAEDIFEDMLYDEYATKMADTANLGIAKMMYKQLSAGLQ